MSSYTIDELDIMDALESINEAVEALKNIKKPSHEVYLAINSLVKASYHISFDERLIKINN